MAALFEGLKALPRGAVAAVIRVYQLMASPYPSPCGYEPSCSTYALEAVTRYGALKGSWLGFRRILRCHPFRPGGYDPVP